MNSIALALLAGILTNTQAATMSTVCQASFEPGVGINFECALLHKDPVDGKLTVIKTASTGALKLDNVQTALMGGAWCAATQALLEPPAKKEI